MRKVICEAISACTDILAYDEGALKAEVTVSCKQEHIQNQHKLHPAIISWNDDPPLIRCSIEKQLPTLELIDERQTCWLIGKIKAKVLHSRCTFFSLSDPQNTSKNAIIRGNVMLIHLSEI